ncbi:MAG: hypothetical protein J6L85_08750 [Clostridia bacterium]|nr:hypothetical protein [Clostridia bacterium]
MLIKNFKRIFKKPDRENEEKLREEIEDEGGLEKKDLPALILSAYMLIIPIALVALLLFYLAAKLFFRI